MRHFVCFVHKKALILSENIEAKEKGLKILITHEYIRVKKQGIARYPISIEF